MENIEILEQIAKQKLHGKNREIVLKRLGEVFDIDQKETKAILLELEKDGDIFCDKNGKVFLSSKLKFIKGTINGNARGFAFCIPEDDTLEDVFIASPNLKGAIHGDKVLISIRDGHEGKTEGVVEKILERGLKTVVGTISVYQKFSFVVPDNKKITKDVFIKKGHEHGAKNGDKVFVTITGYGDKNMTGSVIEILGRGEGDITTDVLSIVRSYELIEEFSKPLLDYCKTIPQSVDASKYSDRLDLRDQIIFTIDGDDTRDFDDAVSLVKDGENYVLGVHIADVGEYVKRDTILDEEAFERGTSVYFPNSVLPMLPKELSNGICSLNPNEDRLALSCIVKIDKFGNVLEHKICESIICSKERMTYKNVTKIIEGDAELCERYKNIVPTLNLMAELNFILEKNRKQRGEIDFDLPEPQILLDEKMEVVDIVKKPRTVSERLIESFMLMANEVVAEHFKKLGIPFVYRIHEVPTIDKIKAFNDFAGAMGYHLRASGVEIKPMDIQKFMNGIEDEEKKKIINSVLLRSMQKAKYSSQCLGHFGLANKYYCHFTSPIRRYPDLTIHRIIKDYLHNRLNEKKLKELSQFVVKSSAKSSEREVLAQRAERDVDDYFKCRYMKNKIGQVFDATIDSVTNFGFFVELENTVEGLVSIASLKGRDYTFNEKSLVLSNGIKRFQIGDKVKVKLTNVNLSERNIDFELVE